MNSLENSLQISEACLCGKHVPASHTSRVTSSWLYIDILTNANTQWTSLDSVALQDWIQIFKIHSALSPLCRQIFRRMKWVLNSSLCLIAENNMFEVVIVNELRKKASWEKDCQITRCKFFNLLNISFIFLLTQPKCFPSAQQDLTFYFLQSLNVIIHAWNNGSFETSTESWVLHYMV